MNKNKLKYNQQTKNTIKENSLNRTKKKNSSIIYIIIAFVVPILLYSQTINFGFTKFDDDSLISRNITFLSNIKNAHQVFLTDAFIIKTSSFYRPLQTLSYMIDIQLSGANDTWMFHLTNVLLLGLIACTLMVLLKRFLIPPMLALLSTMIYCAHPLFISSVAWLPARGELMLTLFSLLSFLFFIELLDKGKIRYLFLNWIAFTIALFCKETAVVFPFIFILYYFTFKQKKGFDKIYILNIILYLVSGVLWYWIRLKAIGSFSNPNDSVIGFTSFLSNLRTIPESISMFILPFDIAPIPCFSILKTLIGVGIIIFFITIFFTTIFFINKERSKREKIFCFSWFLILMFPSMLYKHPFIEYLDHRFFLPLIGMLLFLLFILPKKWMVKGNVKRYWVLIIIFIFLSIFTFSKSCSYSNPITFYNSAINQNSNSTFAYNNRGILKYDNTDIKGAIDDYNKAIVICPNYAEAYYNRGIVKTKTGDLNGTVDDYNKAIALRPNFVEAIYNRGITKANMGDNLGAIDDYTKAIALRPNYAEPFYNRGIAKAIKGDNLGAILDYTKAISINPNYLDAYNNRGILEGNMGNNSGAVADYNKSIAINPNNPEVYNNRGNLKSKMGDYSSAIDDYNKAIIINPNYLDAYFNRAVIKYNLKDLVGTIEDCNKVLKLNPDYKNALTLKNRIQQELNKKR